MWRCAGTAEETESEDNGGNDGAKEIGIDLPVEDGADGDGGANAGKGGGCLSEDVAGEKSSVVKIEEGDELDGKKEAKEHDPHGLRVPPPGLPENHCRRTGFGDGTSKETGRKAKRNG